MKEKNTYVHIDKLDIHIRIRSTHSQIYYIIRARRRGVKQGTRLTTKTYYKRLRARQLLKKANNVELNSGTIKGVGFIYLATSRRLFINRVAL